MQTQSDALKASGLQEHGFQYINIDSGWQGSSDANGRPIPKASTFPDIKALVDHIHANGQKAGIYWIPGIEQPAVDGNYPILGTSYRRGSPSIPLVGGLQTPEFRQEHRLSDGHAADSSCAVRVAGRLMAYGNRTFGEVLERVPCGKCRVALVGVYLCAGHRIRERWPSL